MSMLTSTINSNINGKTIVDNIFIVQAYSMRDKVLKQYMPMLDGNLNATFHELHQIFKKTSVKTATITVPYASKDLDLLMEYTSNMFEGKVNFVGVPYEDSINETREFAHDVFSYIAEVKPAGNTLLIYDYEKFGMILNESHYSGGIIARFNTSKTSHTDERPVAKYFDVQVMASRMSMMTLVMNENQKTFMESQANVEVLQNEKWFSIDFLQKQVNFWTYKLCTTPAAEDSLSKLIRKHKITTFWPYRISDSDYSFELFVNNLAKHSPNSMLFLTDPNNSFNRELYKDLPLEIVVLSEFDSRIHPRAAMAYFAYSDIILQEGHEIIIPVVSDVENVVHQTSIELICSKRSKKLNISSFTLTPYNPNLSKYITNESNSSSISSAL